MKTKQNIMKTSILKITSLFSLIMLTGCFELELENPNFPSEDTFWKTESDLYQGVIAAYDALQIGGIYMGLTQVMLTGISDEGTGEFANEYWPMFRFSIGSDHQYNVAMWMNSYTMIGRAYQVIDRAPGIEGENVNAIAAEARFLAALAYYNLVNIWGENMAYVDRIQQAEDRPRRANDGELYTLMEDLLLAAIPELPLASEYSEADYGRVTKGAAQSLLAKVYMQQHKYTEAEPHLEAVVTSQEYRLLDNFEDNFYERNEVNQEAVFVINFLHDGPASESNRTSRHLDFGPYETKGIWGDVQPTKFVYESFLIEQDRDGNPDPRLDVTLFHENSTELFIGETYSWWKDLMPNPEITTAYFKYSEQNVIDSLANEFDGGTDFILIRYADILLLYAEALNENGKTSDAYQYVDLVRERSNMLPLSTAKPNLDKAAFLEQIKHERVVELSGEVVRFYDLKRWGMYNSSNVIHDPNFEGFVDGRSEFQPIPQSELDLNDNLIQNPGY